MGVEAALTDLKEKELREFPQGTDTVVSNSVSSPNLNTNRTNLKSRKNRRRQKKMLPVQRMYDTCKDVFASADTGIVPSPEKIERLREVLDGIKPGDVGLHPEMSYFRNTARRNPPITYLHLHNCDQFSIGIFCLPPSGVIPLHDHPGMTVFSKLLFGTMHIKSYDWVVDAPRNTAATENQSDLRLAKVKVDSEFIAPCGTSILYPADGGNMHCFTAVTACAVLDVLGPPYSGPDGRDCTYYYDFPFTKFPVPVDGVSIPEEEREGYGWLEERENAEELSIVGGIYSGPKIVEK